jgi:alkylation response protein AidB-like acyl-CoA dehydrogenase
MSAHDAALLEAAEDFARRVIAPAAPGWEASGQVLPRAVVGAYAGLGLAALQVSRARGGGGASYATKLRVAGAIAAECFASGFALNNLQGMVTRMEREGSPEQAARYLPAMMRGDIVCALSLTEPGAGSDAGAIATVARKVAGGWVLDGEKAWVTNGTIADQLLLYAQTEPGAGLPGIASFIVDLHAPGITRLGAEPVAGGFAIGAARIRLDGVHVPDADLFAPPGQAFRRALAGITGARIHVAAMLNAAVRRSLGLAVSYAGERRSFGQTLLEHQGVRWQLAGVATALEASELLAERAATLYAEGGDARTEAAMAKKFAVESAGRGVAACMQAMGAAGLRRDLPLSRHLVAARVAAYVDGTTEMMNERVGAVLGERYRLR